MLYLNMISVIPLKSNKFSVSAINFPTNIGNMLEFTATSCLERVRALRHGATCAIHSVTQEQMRHINWKHRKVSKVTDIVSVSADGVPPDVDCIRELGDIFLCMPVIHQAAKKSAKPFDEYLIRMTMHGILHLAGYDHETEEDYARMLQKEKQLLEMLGIKRSIALY
jgi:probable rRNA maturation factor